MPAPSVACGASTARKRSRVLLVTDSTEPSGVGSHMVTLATALQSYADVALIFSDTSAAAAWAEAARNAGLASEVLPAAALTDGGPAFRSALDRHDPDVVHVHAGIGWEGHSAASAAREWGAPAVVRTEHLPYALWAMKSPLLNAAYARGVQAADRIICVCDAARRTFRMSGADASRFAVVHNGIVPRSPARSREEVRSQLGAGDAKLILTVARFTEQKRHLTLINALPQVLASHPDTRLLWVGTGPLESMLRLCAAELGVMERILFLGSRHDVPDLMNAADVFCLPSHFEGHPLVVLEAMAAGLPVVASRSIGITEAIDNGATGLLVPVNNAAALALGLSRVLNDPDLACRLGTAARARAHQYFSAQRMAEETLAVYRAVLERPEQQDSSFLGQRGAVDAAPGAHRKAFHP